MRSVLKPVNTLVNAQLRSRIAQPVFARAAVMNFSVVPFKLADIGEGIAEVELLKWFVKVTYLFQKSSLPFAHILSQS